MKKRYTEEQIIKAIKQHEAGSKVEDICRQLGISSGTFYNWRAKFAGLEVNEAKRLRELESENNK
ncbi:MAG: transposase, partial [Shewanellaceae bacterium]|nr:transposase [Shewanellaceae bacterium]